MSIFVQIACGGTVMTVELSSPIPGPSRQFAWPRPKYLLFALIGLIYAYVLWTNESFLFNSRDPEWVHIAPFRWFLLPHGMAAAFALFLGPLQFSDRLRRRFATVHRVMGYLYIAGVYLGAPMGIYIQHFEERLGEPRSFTVATVADATVWIFRHHHGADLHPPGQDPAAPAMDDPQLRLRPDFPGSTADPDLVQPSGRDVGNSGVVL